jgi:ubiquinone/menaquinone biosynthesis C-methylase UbiE
MATESMIKHWYENYYQKKGTDRNNLRTNRGVLFQELAAEVSLYRAMYAILHDPQTAKVLDVGCAGGEDLPQLLRVGYNAQNFTGIDILTEQIQEAKTLYPQVNFIQGDASRMEFADDSFDLVFESTMFATLPDNEFSAAIAHEMVRVCKPEGYFLLLDWRTPKPGDRQYKALTRKRVSYLFSVGSATRLVHVCRGALVPPVGRFLSQWLSCSYFLLAAMCPFLVGQVAYVLQKPPLPSTVSKHELAAP